MLQLRRRKLFELECFLPNRGGGGSMWQNLAMASCGAIIWKGYVEGLLCPTILSS